MLAIFKTIYLKLFQESKILTALITCAFINNVVLWIFVALLIKPQEEPIILHYNIYFGPDLIGNWYRFFLLPLSGSIIWITNTFLPFVFKKNHKVATFILAIGNLVSQMILTLASLLLIGQNI